MYGIAFNNSYVYTHGRYYCGSFGRREHTTVDASVHATNNHQTLRWHRSHLPAGRHQRREEVCAGKQLCKKPYRRHVAGLGRNDGVLPRLRGGVRAEPTSVGPALRRPLQPQPPRPPSCCATAPPSLPPAAAAAPLRRRGWATAGVPSAAGAPAAAAEVSAVAAVAATTPSSCRACCAGGAPP